MLLVVFLPLPCNLTSDHVRCHCWRGWLLRVAYFRQMAQNMNWPLICLCILSQFTNNLDPLEAMEIKMRTAASKLLRLIEIIWNSSLLNFTLYYNAGCSDQLHTNGKLFFVHPHRTSNPAVIWKFKPKLSMCLCKLAQILCSCIWCTYKSRKISCVCRTCISH